MSDRGYYVTTPIYYTNGTPHVGHAYTSTAADVLARYARTKGPARFLTGTDEHGQKVADAAAQTGVTPQAWTDKLVVKWKKLCTRYEISYDDFIRTTEERHQRVCIEVFEQLKASGDVYLGKYEGWYCTADETFWLESRLVDGKCPECGRAVQRVSEDNWFFALSRYRDRLLAHFRDNPRWVRPERAYNEMLATIEGGLDDLCISRTNLTWGVPLPGGGVMYVWFDALLNYISALGWGTHPWLVGEPEGALPLGSYWPANVQLVGKEIARFHTIIWPAVLWALGLPEPRCVYAHGWLTVEGEKMSKSRGNVVDPFEIADAFGADTVRYFLLREAPFGSDFSISYDKIRQRRNSDLGNDLGNLLRRSLAMLAKYRKGVVPAPGPDVSGFRAQFAGLPARVGAQIEDLAFRDALDSIWELVTALNRTVEERKPWELAKGDDTAALDALMYDLCEGLRWLAHMLEPFMPEKAAQMNAQLGLTDTELTTPWPASLVWGGLAPGTQTKPGDALFPRLDAPG